MKLRFLVALAALFVCSLATGSDTTSTFQNGDGSPTVSATSFDLMENYPTGVFKNRYESYVQNGTYRHGLILKWPRLVGYTGTDQIPANAVITSATLKVRGVTFASYGQSIKCFAVTEAYNTSHNDAVSWTNRDTSTPWSTIGCNGTPSRASTELDSDTYASFHDWVEFDITAAVQAWADDPTTNLGVILAGDGSSANWACDGVTSSTQAYRPILEVVWHAGSGSDTTAPSTVTNLHVENLNASAKLDWTNPSDSDHFNVTIVRKAGSAPTTNPSNGTAYHANDTLGDGTVVFSGEWDGWSVPSTFTDTGLTNATSYYYKVYAADFSLNYSSATSITAYPINYTVATFKHGAGTNQDWVTADLHEQYPGSAFLNREKIVAGDLYYGKRKTLAQVPNMFGSGTGQVPEGSTIVSAKLTLVTETPYPGNYVAVYRVTESATNGGTNAISWTKRTTTSDWTVPGCGYVSSTEKSRSNTPEDWKIIDKSFTSYIFDITTLVQYWIANPSERYGFTIENETLYATFSAANVSIWGTTATNTSYRPVIEVHYSSDASSAGTALNLAVPSPTFTTPPQPADMSVSRAIKGASDLKATIQVRIPDDYLDVRKVKVYRKVKGTADSTKILIDTRERILGAGISFVLTDNTADDNTEYTYLASLVNSNDEEGSTLSLDNQNFGVGSITYTSPRVFWQQYLNCFCYNPDWTCCHCATVPPGYTGPWFRTSDGVCYLLKSPKSGVDISYGSMQVPANVYSVNSNGGNCSTCGGGSGGNCSIPNGDLTFNHMYANRTNSSSRFGTSFTDNWTIDFQETGTSPNYTININCPSVTTSITFSTTNGGSTWTQTANRGKKVPVTITSATPGSNYTLTAPDGTQHHFEKINGKFLWTYAETRQGARTTLDYDASNNLTTVTDAVGREITFTYQSGWTNDLVASVTLPDSREIDYEYNSGSTKSITDVTYPSGDTSSFGSGTDSDGDYVYLNEAYGSPNVRDIKVYYNCTSAVVLIKQATTDRIVYAARCDVDDSGDLIHTMWEDGLVERLQYSGTGDHTVEATFPGSGRTESLQFNDLTQATSQTDVFGRTQSRVFDSLGNATTRTDADSKYTTYTYNSFSQPLTMTDRLGKVTTMAYDSYGNLESKLYANGTIENWVYDTTVDTDARKFGQATYHVDQKGYVTKMVYNSLRQNTSVVYPDNDAAELITLTVTQRQTASNVLSAVQATGFLTARSGNPSTAYTYNTNGNVLTHTDEVSRVTSFAYDSMLRPTTTTYPDTTTEVKHYSGASQADTRSNLALAMTSRNGFDTTFTYDSEFRRDSTTRDVGGAGTDLTSETTYDSVTGLVTSVDNNGDSVEYAYDGETRVIATTSHPNSSTDLTSQMFYDLAGRVFKTTDPYGFSSYTGYDVLDRVVRTTREYGDTAPVFATPGTMFSSYTTLTTLNTAVTNSVIYDDMDNIIYTIDGRGNSWGPIVYDDLYRIISETDSNGTESTFTFDFNNNKTSETLRPTVASGVSSDNLTVFYEFGARNLLIKFTDPIGYLMRYTYYADTNLNRTDRYVASAGLGSNFYGDTGFAHVAHIERTWGCCRRMLTQLTYADRPSTPTAALSSNAATDILVQYDYDGDGNVVTTTDGEGKEWSATFDGADRVLTQTDPTSVETTYQYIEDGSGDDSRLSSGQGGTVVTQVGPSGLGIITRMTTDGLGRTYSTIHPAGDTGKNRVSTMDYDIQAGGLGSADPILSRSIARNGRVDETTVDGMKRTVKTETDPGSGSHLAIVATYTYDDNSNLLTITDAKSQMTSYSYSNRNLRTAETYHDGKGWSYNYDRASRLTGATDGRGVSKTITYDQLSRPTTISYSGITHADDTFIYTDDELRVEARTVEYNNNCISLYDTVGREVSDEHQFGAVPGTTINEKYLISFTFDRQGNLISQMNPSGQTVSSTYDDATRMLTRSLESLISVTQSYDGAGRLSSKTFANGATEGYSYNGNSWKTQIAHIFTEGGTYNGGLTFDYTFDASGLPLTKSFSRDSNRDETYTYDAADRLTSLSRGIAGSQSWSLDKLGNWDSVTTDSVTQNRDHSVLTPGPQNGLNEITALKDASNTVTDNLSYDDAGNLTAITPVSGTARSFTWDANSRLKTWVKGSTTIGYQYDAYGRRVSDGERRYVYGAGWRVCEERDMSNPQSDATDGSLIANPLLKTLVYGIYLDEVVQYDTKVNPSYNTAPSSNWDSRGDSGYDSSWIDAKTNEQVYNRTYHLHEDQIYSGKALTNSAADLSEFYDYTAYGIPTVYKTAGIDGNWFTSDDTVSINSSGNPLSAFRNDHLYSGQRWETNVLVHFFKNRIYDSYLGRFIVRDRVHTHSGREPFYVYTDSLPLNHTDPFGNRSCKDHTTPVYVNAASGDIDHLENLGTIGAKGEHVSEVFPIIKNQAVSKGLLDCNCIKYLIIIAHGDRSHLAIRGRKQSDVEWDKAHKDDDDGKVWGAPTGWRSSVRFDDPSNDLSKATILNQENAETFGEKLFNDFCFCDNSVIWLFGCYAGLDAEVLGSDVTKGGSLAKRVAEKSKVTVKSPLGSTIPNEKDPERSVVTVLEGDSHKDAKAEMGTFDPPKQKRTNE